MGSKHFIVPYTVLKNKYRVILTALADSRANGFIFINTQYAINIIKFLNVKAKRLIWPI
jgi:hypothetical protein